MLLSVTSTGNVGKTDSRDRLSFKRLFSSVGAYEDKNVFYDRLCIKGDVLLSI